MKHETSLGGKANSSAKSYGPKYVPSKAVDQESDTYWCTWEFNDKGSNVPWYYVFAEQKAITSLEIIFEYCHAVKAVSVYAMDNVDSRGIANYPRDANSLIDRQTKGSGCRMMLTVPTDRVVKRRTYIIVISMKTKHYAAIEDVTFAEGNMSKW